MAALLQSTYPSFHVLALQELNQDDQGIWQRAYPDACPGVVVGNFMEGRRRAYAVLIVSNEQANREVRVILLSWARNNKPEQQQVYEERDVGNLPVIKSGPPGAYEGVEKRERINFPQDVILLEHLESAVTALMIRNGKVRTLTLSN
jgi:hypothetical protein